MEGPDGVEVGLIWGVAKFGKCGYKSLCFRRLAPVVVLQVTQMRQDVDGYGPGMIWDMYHVDFFLGSYSETQCLSGQVSLFWFL